VDAGGEFVGADESDGEMSRPEHPHNDPNLQWVTEKDLLHVGDWLGRAEREERMSRIDMGGQTTKVDRQTKYATEVAALENMSQILAKTVEELAMQLSGFMREDSAKEAEVAGPTPSEWIPPSLAPIRQSRERISR